MDPRIPANPSLGLPMPNNPQASYLQSQMNKFGSNGHMPYMQHTPRLPNFQTSPRMGRNVTAVGSMAGKMHPMEGMVDYAPDSLMPMPNPSMVPNMSMSGDPMQGVYQRGVPVYQHPQGPMMPPGQNVRPHLYNSLSMDLMQQQRLQQSQGVSRFPGMSQTGLQPSDAGMMSSSIQTLDGSPMQPIGNPSAYDPGFGGKPFPGGPGVMRPVPPPLQISQQQQSNFPQQPLLAPQTMLNHQQEPPSMPPRSLETPDSSRQQAQRQISIPPSQQQQQSTAPSLSNDGSGGVGGTPATYPTPAEGTLCLQCSRALSEPPPNPKAGTPEGTNHQQPQPSVQCEAGCRGWYHLFCSGLTPEAFYLLRSEAPAVEWLCSPCTNQCYPNVPYVRMRH